MGGELEVALTDAQRSAAVHHLREQVAASGLSLELFSDAAGAVLAASTVDEVRTVLERVAPVVRRTPPDRRLEEPLVLDVRSGRLDLGSSWQLARTTRVVNTVGRVLLDLTKAQFNDDMVDLELTNGSGTITVLVPHAVDVQFLEMTGSSGSITNEVGSPVSLPGAPLLRIRARTASGRIRIQRPPTADPSSPPRRRWFRRRAAAGR
jgi:hypothetical protein